MRWAWPHVGPSGRGTGSRGSMGNHGDQTCCPGNQPSEAPPPETHLRSAEVTGSQVCRRARTCMSVHVSVSPSSCCPPGPEPPGTGFAAAADSGANQRASPSASPQSLHPGTAGGGGAREEGGGVREEGGGAREKQGEEPGSRGWSQGAGGGVREQQGRSQRAAGEESEFCKTPRTLHNSFDLHHNYSDLQF